MMKNLIDKYNTFSMPLKAAFWFTLANIFQKGVSIVTIPIFTRFLTPEQFGIYSVFQSWLAIITILATLYFWAGVFNNGMIKFEHDHEKFISSLQGLSSVITIGVFLVYCMFYEFFNDIIGLSSFLICIMFIQILFTPALNYWSTKQRFDYKYKKLVFITICMTIANPILGLCAVYVTDQKGIARIISIVIVQVIFSGFFYLYNAKKGKFFFHKEYWKFALTFNLPLIPHYLSQIILNQADLIMINNMIGTFEAGIYSIAYSAGTILLIIVGSINSSLVPWTYKKLKSASYQDIKQKSDILLIIVGAMVLLLVIIAPEAVKLFAPIEYYEAIWVVPPITLSMFFIFLYGLFSNVEFYFEENKFIMFASVGAAVLNIVLNLIFIPLYGYITAGYTTLICYMVYSFAHFIFMKKVCIKHIEGRKLYSYNFILLLSFILIVTSLVIVSLYEYVVIRYLIIIIVVIVLLVRRENVLAKVKFIMRK